jgi:hypothetical protein
MKMKHQLFLFMVFFFGTLSAQNFLEPHVGFSIKKQAYVTLKDGTMMEGMFKGGQEALNGGYKWIFFKPNDGKKQKIKAEDIQSALLPHSALSKISEAANLIDDATRWGDDVKINEDAVKEGYSYMESIVITKKNKEVLALREILNPGYSDEIKVLENAMGLDNPTASIGGIKVAGGDSRSYFFKIGDAKAIKVNASKYEEMFEEIYGSCPEFIEKYGGDVSWADVEEHVFAFSQMCGR